MRERSEKNIGEAALQKHQGQWRKRGRRCSRCEQDGMAERSRYGLNTTPSPHPPAPLRGKEVKESENKE